MSWFKCEHHVEKPDAPPVIKSDARISALPYGPLWTPSISISYRGTCVRCRCVVDITERVDNRWLYEHFSAKAEKKK